MYSPAFLCGCDLSSAFEVVPLQADMLLTGAAVLLLHPDKRVAAPCDPTPNSRVSFLYLWCTGAVVYFVGTLPCGCVESNVSCLHLTCVHVVGPGGLECVNAQLNAALLQMNAALLQMQRQVALYDSIICASMAK